MMPGYVDTGLGHLALGLFRISISESGVVPPAIMVAFDIFEDISSRLLAHCPADDLADRQTENGSEISHSAPVAM